MRGASPLLGMRPIPGGRFTMGSERHYLEERPAHPVLVSPFWMDETAVTNARFAVFVAATGYVTVAEYPLDPALYPGAPPENLAPGSLVFHMTDGPVNTRDIANWWHWVPGASWRAPEGPGSSTEDATITRWSRPPARTPRPMRAAPARNCRPRPNGNSPLAAGRREPNLPGVTNSHPAARNLANTWQGPFPWRNFEADGFAGTCPVRSFPPNPYGLFEMIGNTWEWTTDWFAPRHEADPAKPCCAPTDPRGPRMEGSFDPAQPAIRIPRKVVKGGSFLCAPSYCRRYRPAARHAQMVDSGMSHIGFRCIARTMASTGEHA